jgi:hypothetical protein
MMRSLSVTAVVVALGLGLGLADQASPATAKATAGKPPAPAPAADTAKREACEKTWRAQTKHTGKHKAFIAACVAKG